MAVYTTLVRTIAEQTYLTLEGTSDLSVLQGKTIDDILETVWPYIIPFNMNDGNGLTKKNVVFGVCRHYWMREIGLETVGLWKYAIGTRLQEIMPKYQEMALAQAEMGSIWETSNAKKTHTGQYAKNTDSTETGTDNRKLDETGGNSRTVGEKGNRNIDRTTTEDTTTDFTTSRKVDEDKLTTYQDEYQNIIHTTNTNNLTDTSTAETSGSNHTTHEGSHSKSGNKSNIDKFSDTPQNGLTSVEDGMYLTTYRNIGENTSGMEEERFEEDQTNTGNSTVTDKHTGTTETLVSDDKDGSGNVTEKYDSTTSGTDKNVLDSDGTETVKESSGRDVTESGSNNRNVSDNTTRNRNGNIDETGNDSFNENMTGFNGNKVEFMAQYNEMYVNIYQMIIGEVAGFFLSILG